MHLYHEPAALGILDVRADLAEHLRRRVTVQVIVLHLQQPLTDAAAAYSERLKRGCHVLAASRFALCCLMFAVCGLCFVVWSLWFAV